MGDSGESPTPGPHAFRVLVLAPLGRNAEVLCQTLKAGGVACVTCRDVQELIGKLDEAGAVLLTDNALARASTEALAEALGGQAAWSDVPVIVLASGERLREGGGGAVIMARLREAANVTFLERPARGITLLSTLQAALRARARQYQVRDLLARERAARDEAQRANRVKDEFLATVSHELQTPLSAILLWVRLARRGRVAAKRLPDVLRAIEESAASQSRVIDDLLDASRMIAGKLQIVPEEIALGPVVRAAVEIVRASAEAKGVGLEFVEREGEVRVVADAARVQQVVWNLLTNAVKFTPAGGGVRVGLSAGDGRARVEVKDTGRGIGAGALARVFERFWQGESGTTRAHGGLGLGLAISKELVELHGGKIWAESGGEGKGARFVVELPLAP